MPKSNAQEVVQDQPDTVDETAAEPAATPAAGKQIIKIQSFDFEVPAPYSAGHVLTANEASTLNQTYGENIRNNAASRIKAAKEAAEKDGKTFDLDSVNGVAGTEAAAGSKTLRQVIDEYAATYVFGVRTARSSEPADPVEREAKRIATDVVNEALRGAGTSKSKLAEGQYDAAVAAYAALEGTQTEARRRVEERAKIGKATLDLSSLGIQAPAPAAAQPETEEPQAA